MTCRKVFDDNYLRRQLGGDTRSIMITIESIQIGSLRTEGDPSARDLITRRWTTGFYKVPIEEPVQLGPLGIDGDAVADTRFHGGPDKAVLCYAASHYPLWVAENPDLKMSAGALGENLTLSGVDESTVFIGDRFRIADCEVEVSQPRQPCWKISRRWGEKTLTKQVVQSGRTGWYLRVIKGGVIARGHGMELLARPHPSWSVGRANDVMFSREADRMAVMELMNLPELAEAWRKDIA